MTNHSVNLTDDAQSDLQDIYDYIAEHDVPLKADQLLSKLEGLIASLSQFPERGAQVNDFELQKVKCYILNSKLFILSES